VGPFLFSSEDKAVDRGQVIEGSGRVADLIAYAWRYLHDTRQVEVPFLVLFLFVLFFLL
jgi:hypothetical protein